jgi:hypothetical protein
MEDVEAENRPRVSTYKIARPLTTSLASKVILTSIDNHKDRNDDSINDSNHEKKGYFAIDELDSNNNSFDVDAVQEPTDTIEGRTETQTNDPNLSKPDIELNQFKHEDPNDSRLESDPNTSR